MQGILRVLPCIMRSPRLNPAPCCLPHPTPLPPPTWACGKNRVTTKRTSGLRQYSGKRNQPRQVFLFFSHIRNLITDMCLVIILLFTHTETFGCSFAVWRPIYFTGQLKVFVLVLTFLETKEDWITFARSNTKRKEKESKRSLDSWKIGWQFF